MKVKRIVSNIFTPDLEAAEIFYKQILGLELLMNHGWIQTYGSPDVMTLQISFAIEGGSGTPVPDLSIEVDNVDEALQLFIQKGFKIEYGPCDEPWRVRRFYVRDPFGNLVNILSHQ